MESEYCAHGDTFEIEVFESTIRLYRKYAFSASVTNKCERTKYVEPTKNTPIAEGINKEYFPLNEKDGWVYDLLWLYFMNWTS